MKVSPGEIIETVLELKGGEVDLFALHGGQLLAAGCCEGKVHLPLVLLAASAAHKAQSLHRSDDFRGIRGGEFQLLRQFARGHAARLAKDAKEHRFVDVQVIEALKTAFEGGNGAIKIAEFAYFRVIHRWFCANCSLPPLRSMRGQQEIRRCGNEQAAARRLTECGCARRSGAHGRCSAVCGRQRIVSARTAVGSAHRLTSTGACLPPL